MRVILSLISLLVCMLSCNHQAEIIGHWRPADAFIPGQVVDNPKFRDWVFNSDSTFISVGLEPQPKQTEGWNNGITQRGAWSISNGVLSLLVEDVSFPARFKILKLTDKELVLESEMMKSVQLNLIRMKK